MGVLYTGAVTRKAVVNINKCSLADVATGIFFSVCILAVCKPTWSLQSPNVLDCVHMQACPVTEKRYEYGS